MTEYGKPFGKPSRQIPARVAAECVEHIAKMSLPIVEESVDYMGSGALALVESPIEYKLLIAMFMYHRLFEGPHIEVISQGYAFNGVPYAATVIVPQYEVSGPSGKMRFDFALMKSPGMEAEIAIECDGHDFHERTKEQAKSDRSRDRAIQARGLKILRFTGSEIHNDPFGCAAEVFRIFSTDRGD